jgi:serine/threonine protein kinase
MHRTRYSKLDSSGSAVHCWALARSARVRHILVLAVSIDTRAVYLGLNLDSGELIAVKQVELVGDVTMHVSELAALQHEISVMRTLNNENIVRYLGSSIEENVFNIFLEYVPGGSIASLIRKFSKLNEKIIRLYTKQILMGLEYLHSHQIIHRDIKGANILVDNKGIIKLADFGASRRLEGLFAQTGEGCRSLKGTVRGCEACYSLHIVHIALYYRSFGWHPK